MAPSFSCRLIALFLALFICISCFPSAVFADALPPSPPTPPPDSVSDATNPDESLPGESQPGNTQPEESQPEDTQPEESLPIESQPREPQPVESQLLQTAGLEEEDVQIPSGPGLYFGQLHAHTNISDGTGTVEEAFQYASQVEGLDFFAVTDHSESFDQSSLGQIGTDASSVSSDWAAGKAAASGVTSASFVGLFGYEMSWPYSMQIGHISTFNTPGFQSWQQASYSSYNTALQNYYETLSAIPGSVSQFNHPGTKYGTFDSFEYSPQADQVITLL